MRNRVRVPMNLMRFPRQSTVAALALLAAFSPLGVLLPATASAQSVLSEYPIPTSNTQPNDIATGSDGALWFTESNSGNIGRITTTGSITEFPLPNSATRTQFISNGPDGAMWFNEWNNNSIGRITTSGAVTDYQIPTLNAAPGGVTAGPDGAMWFTEQSGNKIGRISTTGGITEYPVPTSNAYPDMIAAGPDGALWFTEGGYQTVGKIGRISTTGGITEYPVLTGNSTEGIAAGPDGALWFTESVNNQVGRITASGQVSEYSIPSSGSYPLGITAGQDGNLWFTEAFTNKIGSITPTGVITEYPVGNYPYGLTVGPDGAIWFAEDEANKIGRFGSTQVPSFPTNLAATSPAQYPSLSWNASSGATSYNIYRNGTNVGSTTNTTYADNTAPEGTDTYYVTAVNTSGESGHSNTVSVLVDRTAPTITYSVSPSPNVSGWNHSPVTVTYTCTDNSGGSGIASCSTPQSESTDGSYTLSGSAVDNAGNSSSVSVTVNLDQTAPTLGTPAWTNNPMTTTQSTTVTVPVTDNLSGVAKGEYYLGTTDPGQGNGTAMTLSSGNLSASFSNQTPGIYTINFRAEDTAGNWSPITTDYLVVYDTTKTSADGHSGDIEPVYGTDVLPGLLQTGQHDKEHFAFTVKYKNGTLDSASKVHFDYKTGTHCINPNQATNCHDTTLDATSIAWMVINGTNNAQATVQGTATLTIDGVTTTNPFRIITTDGSLLNPQTTDQFELDIYAPNANPNTAQPIYHISDPLAKGNVVVKA
jgi:virginiamycin B lyase